MSIVHLDPVMGIFDRNCAHIDRVSLQLLTQIRDGLVRLCETTPGDGISADELRRITGQAQALTLRLGTPKGVA